MVRFYIHRYLDPKDISISFVMNRRTNCWVGVDEDGDNEWEYESKPNLQSVWSLYLTFKPKSIKLIYFNCLSMYESFIYFIVITLLYINIYLL